MAGASLAAVTTVTALLLAGCGGGAHGAAVDRLGSRPAKTAAPTGSASAYGGPPSAVSDDGPTATAARQLLARYTGWWQAQATAFADSSRPGDSLGLFSTGQALSASLANLHRLQEAGMVMQGQPRNNARVTALDLGATPQTAAIEDCLDVSGWHQADAKTKQIRDPKRRLSRYIVTATADNTKTGWLITSLTPEPGQTC
ncbi:hypothetical protein ACIQGZ_12770 [Streptomyces sp. NPDC092296]|uniref:hypothetical protein n=1 Tax=Streptomyces sp. NPDC092296 TaxID=3366012 RepID=UPI003800502A